ncbi:MULTISPECIES: ATP phosphoribosyltransferase regulatory subunit [Dehalobacter]|jgi:ATP phosphoribosyltransferase regulatory subunit|uniref:ATP phosphoribosyltransferase regulatory subunit n=2 Tax=Dehalobacter restrictus TaxID=55583 RepID=A0A857DJK5_9FIRM|nr:MULTISPECIES: ATP phosphoribosyltransferase regulatory subunit [Dehalobacter]AHF10510.1 ATP phosphoribosyltransferase [Dehalobacter restrictus DSM 9455]MCG1025434.1 ATP phosphoribosyltransferase regulatory subunit [Dehalobacter sp.]MDJ0305678.1 ATP phosphoribosyltransferase regulatory subunit [Dehalobacter sp.]OCZ51107.1 ATP phosphoribosyltransferase regulatory subunit [Dehalobacter sp. TeCB1]QHA01137.1 ATP phosphoribosyltransferase regulatory subunit [Dehalobacter restrictus]
MERSSLGLKIPEGMIDLLPAELAQLEELEGKAISVCKNWSYQKVATPGLEYRACVEPDADKDDHLYKFFDKNGHILALRPEFTTPIARMVATRQKGGQFPLRFCYSGDVYRNDSARYREFRQVGVELIGSDNDIADAEVIALAIEIMKTLEIKNFQLNLGHNGIFSGLAEEMKFETKVREELEDGIARKDMVKLEKIISSNDLPESAKELLLSLPYLTGKEEVLDKLQNWTHIKPIRKAVESLRTIYLYLKEFGVQDYVSLDLGILRGFSYYTGAIFEGYLPGIGVPLIEGGRYDGLYADFGMNHGATGFAVNLGFILEKAADFELDMADVLVYGQSPGAVIKRCRELRKSGKKVEMALGFLEDTDARNMASSRGIALLEKIESNK